MKKRLLSLVLACVVVFALCACGAEKENGNNQGKTENGQQVWYMGGNNIFAGDVDVESLFEGVEDSIDPAQIYNSVEITEQMIHGTYTLNDKDKDLESVRQEIPFAHVQFKENAYDASILPTSVFLGADNICSQQTGYDYDEYRNITDYEVAVLEFATEEKLLQVGCIYEVDGRKITFKHITQTSAEGEPFAYETTGVEFSYDFAISGPYMTFSKDGSSLQLMAYCLTENVDSELRMDGYSLPDSPLIEGLDYFASSHAWNYAVARDGSYFDMSAYKLTEDGRFTLCLSNEDISGETESFVGQYAYIIQSEASNFLTGFSVVLLDGNKVYYYTDDITQREARALEDQGVNVNEMTEDEIEEIAEKKSDLFDDLYNAFEAEGIDVTINRSTGEIALDSAVLFGVNESETSDEGKAFLQKFMKAYTSVVFGEKYENFVSKIMVEGHTDTSGSYELNQTLSQARADSVKDYCLSADCGIGEYTDVLQSMLEAVGYSYDKPVYDENGEVDMDASRRVSFRFIVNIEKQG